jgi:hypothetical protein
MTTLALLLLVTLGLPAPATPYVLTVSDREALDRVADLPFGASQPRIKKLLPELDRPYNMGANRQRADARMTLFGAAMTVELVFVDDRLLSKRMFVRDLPEQDARGIYESLRGYLSGRLHVEPESDEENSTAQHRMLNTYWVKNDVEFTLTFGVAEKTTWVGWSAYSTEFER